MTMQKQERLLYEDHEYPLLSRPLEQCLDPVVYAKVQSMIHDGMRNSSLHRNYRGYWMLRDGTLWLEDLLVLDEERLSAIDPSHPRPGIASLFSDAKGPVPATWVSGDLLLGTGEAATRLYYRVWSEHLVLTLKGGRMLRSERRSNWDAFNECRRRGDLSASFWTDPDQEVIGFPHQRLCRVPSRKATRDSSPRNAMMARLDPYELDVLKAYESGKLKPVAAKAELQKMRAAARATAKLTESKAGPARR